MIAVEAYEMDIIIEIIKKHISNCYVLAFGSRIKGTNNAASDLDLAVVGSDKISFDIIGAMKEDFMESDIPYKVDVLDYNGISPTFKKIIDAQNIPIYPNFNL